MPENLVSRITEQYIADLKQDSITILEEENMVERMTPIIDRFIKAAFKCGCVISVIDENTIVNTHKMHL